MMRALILIALISAPPAAASQHRCMARVVKDVRANEDPASTMRRGTRWGPVTQLRVNTKTGTTSFCAHGDYCYQSGAFEMISPCRFVGGEWAVRDPNSDDITVGAQ